MKKRKTLAIFAFPVVAAAFLTLAYAAEREGEDDKEDAEETVAFAALPEAARKAAEAFFGTAEGLNASKEIEEGATLYEVEGSKAGAATSIKLTEAGDLVEVEQGTSFENLPAAAQRELKKDYPGGKFAKVESVQLHFYEVKVETKDGMREVRVFASGDIEDGEDDHENDHEDDDDDDRDDDAKKN